MEEAAREEEEWSCPICCSPWTAVALVQPCQHRFCLGCIVRWVRISPSCPLCRGLTDTIKVSVWGEENDLEYIPLPIPFPTTQPPVATDAAESPLSPPRASSGAQPPALVGGISATERAALLRAKWSLLALALPWLRATLAALFGEQSCLATATEKLLLHLLCCCGPDPRALGHQLEPLLGQHTHRLVRGLVRTVKLRCGEEAQALLRCPPASEEEQEREQGEEEQEEENLDLDEAENLDEDFEMEDEEEEDDDEYEEEEEEDDDEYEEEEMDEEEEEEEGDEDEEDDEDDEEEEEVTSSSADMAEDHSSVLEDEGPISAEPEQPREEAVAGPCGRSPAAAGGHSEPVPAALRCLRKRRAPSAPAAPAPCKRPSQRRH